MRPSPFVAGILGLHANASPDMIKTMTATLDSHGHLVLPLEAHRIAESCPSKKFDVLISTSGIIMLRPERKPRRSLVESFQALRGIELSPRRDPMPDPIEL